MRFPHHARIFRGQLDAAPFLGVLMLLLILLLLSSSLVFVPGVPIQLPEAAPLPGPDTPTVVVAVDKSGQFYFDNQVCDEARLQEKLKLAASAARSTPTLIVQADRGVRYEVVVRLGLLARAVGVKHALLATRPEVTPTVAAPDPP
jgi:biopolymer transport protein ExbD